MPGHDAPLRDQIRHATELLRQSGVPSPQVDAEILAAHVARLSRGELLAATISGRQVAFDSDKYAALIAERCDRVPLQHLTGRATFCGLELAVGPGVFVPRPETEQVAAAAIDAAQAAVARDGEALVVDLCSGSGAIAFAVAAQVPQATVHAVEVSELALAWAHQNVALVSDQLGRDVGEQLTFHNEDAATALPQLTGQVAVVVSNPPYIPPDAVPNEPEVRDHDPQLALYGGGVDGLAVPEAVLARAGQLLRPGGVVIIEHAEVQAPALRARAQAANWAEITTLPDLAGRPRMLVARRAPLPLSGAKVEE